MSDVPPKLNVFRQHSKVLKTQPEKLQLNNVRRNSALEGRQRRLTNSNPDALEELVQCGICLERLNQPRMLPCQHTFCLSCLQSHMVAKKMVLQPQPPSITQVQNAMANLDKHIQCPVCMHQIPLPNGLESLEALPRNLYIDSLLKVLECGSPGTPTKDVFESKCVKCRIVCDHLKRVCQHCLQGFCSICWGEHMQDLEGQLGTFGKQLEESEVRLNHKLDNFEDRCKQLVDSIEAATQQKIAQIQSMRSDALKHVQKFKEEGTVSSKDLKRNIENAKNNISLEKFRGADETHKVLVFMNFHKETSKLVDTVLHWGETRTIFDPDSFKLDQDVEGIYSEIEEDATNGNHSSQNPLENPETMMNYYQTRPFVPKLVWTKCPRPAGLGIPPWETNHLYIAATDNHNVLILDLQKMKLIGRLTSPDMLCPQSLTFSATRQEIYVSDKWKHCIHVFSNTGEHLRMLGSKGSGDGKLRSPDGTAMGLDDELVVCDTGNERVLILDPVTGEQIRCIGINGKKTELNAPTGVAVYNDTIIVADSGNHKIKLYNFDGAKVGEFGSLGRQKGELRSAEVVTVDPMGFVLVGDAGNARIQVFKLDGTFVKAFGSANFAWISGVVLTPNLDIVVTDLKKRKLQIF